MEKQKIFGIGLNRTGTGSLATALKILGYKVSHWEHHQQISHYLTLNRFDFPVLQTHDAILDLPIPAIFKELYEHYPDAYFIYTYRHISDWLKSQEKHHKQLGEKGFFECKLTYGSYTFNKDLYEKSFIKHVDEVTKYFIKGEGKKAKFLPLKCGEDNWLRLTHFLNKPLPKQPWPHVNRLK